jgi:hypothetical protein
MTESLGDGSFGMHDVLEGTSFLVHSNCLKNKVWVGGKDDWLVISDNKWSLELVNLGIGEPCDSNGSFAIVRLAPQVRA